MRRASPERFGQLAEIGISGNHRVGGDLGAHHAVLDLAQFAVVPDDDGQVERQIDEDQRDVLVQQPKVYTKAAPSPITRVVQQKERKNQMSRSRSQKRKRDIEEIQSKPPKERTTEEQDALDKFMGTRDRKNNRSRERAQEKKDEVERIMAKPLKHRTKIEIAFLEQYTQAKKRKNEGDRLRQQKLKQMIDLMVFHGFSCVLIWKYQDCEVRNFSC